MKLTFVKVGWRYAKFLGPFSLFYAERSQYEAFYAPKRLYRLETPRKFICIAHELYFLSYRCGLERAYLCSVSHSENSWFLVLTD